MPERVFIEGGVPLRGEVTASGAKNAALPLMAASILLPGELILENVPGLRDVVTMRRLLEHLGVRCQVDNGTWSLDASSADMWDAPYDLVKTMRASVLVLGPLVARFGRARVSQPGGCAIGARPINRHIEALEAMGASVWLEHGYVVAQADRLKGAEIVFEAPTVTGTENIMMACVRAGGDRQQLHEAIRSHSMAAGRRVKEEGEDNDLLQRLAGDPLFAADRDSLGDIVDPAQFIGRAPQQVATFLTEHVDPVLASSRPGSAAAEDVNV